MIELRAQTRAHSKSAVWPLYANESPSFYSVLLSPDDDDDDDTDIPDEDQSFNIAAGIKFVLSIIGGVAIVSLILAGAFRWVLNSPKRIKYVQGFFFVLYLSSFI